MNLKGLYTAAITPFTALGEIDEPAFRENLRLQIQHQVAGVVVLGSTGECWSLKPQEKEKLITIAVEELKGKTQILVGTGSSSTEETIEATKQAMRFGADAALVVVPYYSKPSQEGIARHFSAIASAVSLPLCLYNNPGRSMRELESDTLKRLLSIPSIVAIKDSSQKITQCSDYLLAASSRKESLALLAGDDDMTLPCIALGAQGVIAVSSNLFLAPMKALTDSALKGDFVEARKWHFSLLPFFKMLSLDANPIVIKFAMEFYGKPAGPCRLPLCELSLENQKSLAKLLESLPKNWR